MIFILTSMLYGFSFGIGFLFALLVLFILIGIIQNA